MKKALILILCCFNMPILQAQDEVKSIAIQTFSFSPTGPDYFDKKNTEYLSTVSRQFVRDGRFSVVERHNLEIIEQERELQKSEAFIDGKVVQQGAGIGADYLVSGHSDFLRKVLTLSLYDVATGLIIGTEDLDLTLDYKLNSLVDQKFIHRYFPIPSIVIVKVLEGNNKATSVLIAAGSKSGLVSKEKLEVVEQVSEMVNGEQYEREVTIGIIRIDQIENENFTICKVDKGGKLIAEKLANGISLYCKKSL